MYLHFAIGSETLLQFRFYRVYSLSWWCCSFL